MIIIITTKTRWKPSEGQEIDVKLIGFDRGKMKLSAKALIEKSKPEVPETDSISEE